MEAFIASFGIAGLVASAGAMATGGFAKGVVGFALPLVALSVMASFLPAKTAVALMILPIFVSNLSQALRNGVAAARDSLLRYWRLNLVFVVAIALSAQLVALMSDRMMFGLLGVTITGFGASQLLGWRLRFDARFNRTAEILAGIASGIFGGLAGIWGPPLIMYLLAADTPKVEMIRVQSITFLIGAVALFVAHLNSGIMNAMMVPVSGALVIPTMAGMFLGYRVQDRLDAVMFRHVTLVVLVLSGLNLLRRAAGF